MDKIKYLSQARLLNKQINVKLERYEELKARAEKATKVLTGMPRGGSSKTDDTLAKIADMSNELNEEIDKLVDLEKEIAQTIKQLSGEKEMVLELYYLCFNTWSQVAKKLGYEERHIYRIHNQAVKELKI